MAQAQGSLEYLAIIAVVIAIAAIVSMLAISNFGAQKESYIYGLCRQASSICEMTMNANPQDPCTSCKTACNYSNGTQIFNNAVKCCRFGLTESIYSGALGAECAGCRDDSDCGTEYCINKQCKQCRTSQDCVTSGLGDLCVDNMCCDVACSQNTDCSYSGSLSCVNTRVCNIPGTCQASCAVTYKSTGTQCASPTTVWSCLSRAGRSYTVQTVTSYACDASHVCASSQTVTETQCDCSICEMVGNLAQCKDRFELCVGSINGAFCGYSTTGQQCGCYPTQGYLQCKVA